MDEANAAFRRVQGEEPRSGYDGLQAFAAFGAGCVDDHIQLDSIQQRLDLVGLLEITDVKGDAGNSHSR